MLSNNASGLSSRQGRVRTGFGRGRPESAPLMMLLAVVLLLTGCMPAGRLIPTDGVRSPSTQVEASLTASPNPVPAGDGLGTATIAWSTGDGSVGQVYVSEDGGPEKLFAQDPAGSVDAPWIRTGAEYEFRLYAGTERRTLLNAVMVTRGAEGIRPTVDTGATKVAWLGLAILVTLGAYYAYRRRYGGSAKSPTRFLVHIAAMLPTHVRYPALAQVERPITPAPPQTSMSLDASRVPRMHDLGFMLLGCAILAAAWSRLLLSDVSLLVLHDASEQTYPWWQFSVTAIQHNELPLWDPYTVGGKSHVGEGQTGVFYPPFLAFAFLGGSWASTAAAIQLFAFLHALLGFSGAYLLARVLALRPLAALGCGLTFALGGFVSVRAFAQLNIYTGTAWTPFVLVGPLLAFQRCQVRWGLVSGAALALSVLAGHAQPALHAGLALGLMLAVLCFLPLYPDSPSLRLSRTLQILLLTIASAAAFAAVQLFPMFEYLPLAFRWVGGNQPVPADATVPYATIAQNPSLEAQHLPTMIFHNVRHVADGSLYIGSVAFVMAVLGASCSKTNFRVLWICLVAFGLLLSLGDATPLLSIVYWTIPMIDKARSPIRFLLLAHLGASVLVGFGINHVIRRVPYTRPVQLGLIGAGLFIAMSFAVTLPNIFASELIAKASGFGLLLAIIVGIALCIGTRSFRGAAVAGMAILIFMAIELGISWASGLPSRSSYDALVNREIEQHYNGPTANAVREFLGHHPGLYRVDFVDSPVPRNFGDVIRVPTVSGFGATSPRRFFELRQRLGFLPPNRATDILGVRFLVSKTDLKGVEEVRRFGSVKIYENPGALPLAWFVDKIELTHNDTAAIRVLGARDFDPMKAAVIVADESSHVPDVRSGAVASVDIQEYAPTLIRMTVRTDRAALLVTSESDYPGWVARLGPQTVSTVRVNYAFRGIPIPEGEHVLELRYEPQSVMVGGAISVAAVATSLVTVGLWLGRSALRSIAARGGKASKRVRSDRRPREAAT
jgi:hypothetical protein